MCYVKYLISVLRHKWFVFVEACKLGIPFLGLAHDMSKFLPDEFIPYARYFYGRDGHKSVGQSDHAFNIAWLKHQKRNKHHWQWWVLMNDNPDQVWTIQEHSMGNPPILAMSGSPLLLCEYECAKDDAIHTLANSTLRTVCDMLNKLQPLDMPDRYRREMLADWKGAGRAYGNPDTAGWYDKNRTRIILSGDTRFFIEERLRR